MADIGEIACHGGGERLGAGAFDDIVAVGGALGQSATIRLEGDEEFVLLPLRVQGHVAGDGLGEVELRTA